MPIIASTDRALDIEPYCRVLFSQELNKFVAIFPHEFPQGSREVEDAFLRQFFSDSEIQVQGGAEGEGKGFRFLKHAWLWVAHWNLNCRVPLLAQSWMEDNQNILNDPDMKKRIFEPHVQPSTFFDSKQIDSYGDKLLRIVIKHIQHVLSQPAPASADEGSPVIVHSGLNHQQPVETASVQHNTEGIIKNRTEKAAKSQQPTEAMASNQSRVEAMPPHDQILGQQAYPNKNGKAQQQRNSEDITTMGSHRGAHSKRGSKVHGSHNSNGNRGARAGQKAIYGRQDARYQSPVMEGTMGAATMPMQPPNISAGSYAAGQTGYTPPTYDGTQFASQTPPMPPMNGLPTPYGYPFQGNFQAQFHQHLPDHVGFPPGLATYHAYPFGDRSNFPSDGRNFSNESRLYDPDEKPKNTKQGSYGGNGRGQKHRGQSYTNRGGNRGQNTFGQSGYNVAREGRTFQHHHPGSGLHGTASAGQFHNMQNFGMYARDKQWQPPSQAEGSSLPDQNYGHAPHMATGAFPSAPDTGSGIAHQSDGNFVSPDAVQQTSTGHGSIHQRVLSKSMPCAPTECNKYSIGDECDFAKEMIIFQVPLDMTPASFEAYFSTLGKVEAFKLYDESNDDMAPSQRRMGWVLFAHADSTRAVLHRRGKSWAGGPMLFAEVAGEFWDPGNKFYTPHQISRTTQPDSQSQKPTDTSRTPRATDGDPETSASGSIDHKKKPSNSTNNNNKKPKKSSPFVIDEGTKDGVVRHNSQPKRVSSSGDAFKRPSGPATSVAGKATTREKVAEVAIKPAETFLESMPKIASEGTLAGAVESKQVEDTDGVVEGTTLETNQSVEFSTSATDVDGNPSSVPAEELVRRSVDNNEVATLVDSATEAAFKPSDDQVDDSFHTADGASGGDRDSMVEDKDVTQSGTHQAASIQVECLARSDQEPVHTAGDTADTAEPAKTTQSSLNGASLPVDDLAATSDNFEELKTANVLPEHDQLSIPVDHTVVKKDGSKRSVTISVPSIDTSITAEDSVQDKGCTVRTGDSRAISDNSVSGAPASAFVTAPSTPAIPEPNKQIQSKKGAKSKGPKETESFSVFSKQKLRKPSSKRTKPSVEARGKPAGVSSVPASNQAVLPGIIVPVPATVVGDVKTATETIAVKDSVTAGSSEGKKSAESLPEPPPTRSWSVTDLVQPVKAFLAMGSTSNDTKSTGPLSSDDGQPDVPADAGSAIVQSVEVEGYDTSSKDVRGRNIDFITGLGISEATATTGSGTATERTLSPEVDESKLKKKNAKSKSKNRKSKAKADVTIVGNTLVSPKPSEPIHEFVCGEVTSDSSSQTLGRMSPVTKRPSMKRIDEAKQPKALLEPRPVRQNRQKKHNSVHGIVQSSKTEGTDDMQSISVLTPSNCTIILAPLPDGTYLVCPVQLLTFSSMQRTDIIEQQPQEVFETGTGIDLERLMLMPVATPETSESSSKSSPTPEKPYEPIGSDEVEVPSPEAVKSQEKLRQLNMEEAEKKKFA